MRLTPQLPAIVAHRGASAHAPENTLAAFELALLQGADVIECDMRTTSDGELVLVHDETLLRTTGDPRAVAEVALADLAELDDAVRPPTLAEVLDSFGDGTNYLVDVKRLPRVRERQFIDAIACRGLGARVVVQSFDHLLLRRLSLQEPLLSVAAAFAPQADARRSVQLVARFVSGIAPFCATTDAALVRTAHRHGLAIWPWTVNEECEMQRLIDLGVDGLITDVPDRACALVGAAVQVA